MGYVVAIVIVVLIVLAFATFLVINATRKRTTADAADPGSDQNPLGIIGTEEGTPVGDTSEHAGVQDQEGRTVGEQDAAAHGGSGRAVGGGYAGTGEVGSGRERDPSEIARPVVGGEGEGERSV